MSKTIKSDGHELVNLYSIKDVTVDAFGVLFEARTDDEAARMVSHMIALQPDNLLAMFPNDYQLFRIATFNRLTGSSVSDVDYICAVNALPRGVQLSIDDVAQAADRSHEAGAAA